MMALSVPQGLSQGFQYALHAHTNPQVIDHRPTYSIPLTIFRQKSFTVCKFKHDLNPEHKNIA